jgi:hypothetical protein
MIKSKKKVVCSEPEKEVNLEKAIKQHFLILDLSTFYNSQLNEK